MKRLFITFILFLMIISFTADSFAKQLGINRTGVVQAGETVTIYENHTSQYVIVTVIVSDYGAGIDSKITAYRNESNYTDVMVTDGNTICCSFVIGGESNDGKIVLEANGSEGICMYEIQIDIPDIIY